MVIPRTSERGKFKSPEKAQFFQLRFIGFWARPKQWEYWTSLNRKIFDYISRNALVFSFSLEKHENIKKILEPWDYSNLN